MNFQRVSSGSPWEERNGYSRAIRVQSAGDPILITGTTAVGPDGRIVAPNDPFAQTLRCYEIIEKALADLGAGKRAIVRSRVFTTDAPAFAEAIGQAHKTFFADHRPCLTLIGGAQLVDPDMLVEIEADAFAPPHAN